MTVRCGHGSRSAAQRLGGLQRAALYAEDGPPHPPRSLPLLSLSCAQVGKTAVGLDMMINQAFLNERLRWQEDFGAGTPVSKLMPTKACYCIYVGVGQKQSTISRIAKILRKPRHLYERRFLDATKEAPYFFQPANYSIIVASISSDSAPLQYLAPYTGCTVS